MPSRGHVYRRSDRPGWYARLKVQGRYCFRGGFETEEAARLWLSAERTRLEREEILGVPVVRGELTMGRFLPRWKEWARSRWGPNTLASSLIVVEGVILPAFKDRAIGKVTPADLEDFLSRLQTERGISPATRNRYLGLLSGIFRLAIRLGYARENPVAGVERGKERIRAMPYLKPEDEARLLATLPGWLKVPVLLALDTGLRAGELGALTRRDVDLGRAVLGVRTSKNRTPRQVGLTRRAATALADHLQTLPRAQERLFVRPRDGRPLSGQSYRSAFRGAVERAGLDGGTEGGRFRFHDCRHMAGVRLAEAGATLAEIKATLGHKSLAATLRYLDHAPRDASRNAGRLLDAHRRAGLESEVAESVIGAESQHPMDDQRVRNLESKPITTVDDHGSVVFRSRLILPRSARS